MKKLTSLVIGLLGLIVLLCSIISCSCTTDNTRDYTYEAYCDSIWENDPYYYLDCLVETDEYQQYIEQHGHWWE